MQIYSAATDVSTDAAHPQTPTPLKTSIYLLFTMCLSIIDTITHFSILRRCSSVTVGQTSLNDLFGLITLQPFTSLTNLKNRTFERKIFKNSRPNTFKLHELTRDRLHSKNNCFRAMHSCDIDGSLAIKHSFGVFFLWNRTQFELQNKVDFSSKAILARIKNIFVYQITDWKIDWPIRINQQPS